MVFSNTAFLLLAVFSLCLTPSAFPQSDIDAEPLHPRSGPEGETMFTELGPDRTGIAVVNRYDDPRMWGDRYQEMVFGTIGTGIAVADFDQDGLPDVYVPIKTGGSKLYRNLGDWRFEDVTESAGVAPASSWTDKLRGLFVGDNPDEDRPWDQGATFADINNDGWLDLYVTCFAAPNRLYINQGDGTFAEEAEARGLKIVDGSGVAAFCDFDRDGWLDLYLQTNMLDVQKYPEGRPDYLFRNDGEGFYSDVTRQAGISGNTSGHSATWWDYDEDGWPDLYVANDFSKPDKLYRNLSDGTFVDTLEATVPITPYYSMGADAGDVDNDGRIDFFVSDMAPTSHEKDQRGMALSRARELGKWSDQQTPPQMRNALFLNTGTGRMREGAWMFGIARTDWTWSTRFEDLDNDGYIDLHVTNGMVREYHNADILNRVMGAVSRQAQRSVMRSSPVFSEANLAFRNSNGQGFTRTEREWGLGQVGVSFGAAFGDFDKDGDLDLIYANYAAPPTVLRNDSQTGNRAIFALRGTTSNSYGAEAIVQIETASGAQMRQLTLARGYLSSSEPVLHFGLGGDSEIRRATIRWPSGHTQIFEGLSANQRYTIRERRGEATFALPDSGGGTLFENVSDKINGSPLPSSRPSTRFSAQPLAPQSFIQFGPSLALGDWNGNDLTDFAVGSKEGGTQLYLGTDTGLSPFETVDLPSQAAVGGLMLVADFDGDDHQDLLVIAAHSETSHDESKVPHLYSNDGSGRLTPTTQPTLPSGPALTGSASVADFNGDGQPDVFIGARVVSDQYPMSDRSVLLLNRGEEFEDVTDRHLPNGGNIGMVTGSVWSDVDNDGWPDLVVSTDWGHVRYFRNIDGQRFEDVSESLGFHSSGKGLWTCLAQGDFNSDGRPDFVAGNIGLNTRYRANEDEPSVLYYGNFGGRGPGQIGSALRGGKAAAQTIADGACPSDSGNRQAGSKQRPVRH